MITGIHSIIYTRSAEADRAFFRDAPGFPSVDAGAAADLCGTSEANSKEQLYLMCGDLRDEIDRLGKMGITCGSLEAQPKAPHRDIWDDQALSRYPVLKIHPTAAMHKTKKAMIMARLTPALISEVP